MDLQTYQQLCSMTKHLPRENARPFFGTTPLKM